jgi:nicotinamide mononucleotide transporter
LSLHEIWQQFVANIKETRWQEWVSTVTQIASVWYARKNNILVYPTGIIGVVLAAYVYFFKHIPPYTADGLVEYLLFYYERLRLV